MSIEISGVSFTGFENINYNGDGVDLNSQLIINPDTVYTGTYTLSNLSDVDNFVSMGIPLNFSDFSGFAMGANITQYIQLQNSNGTPLTIASFRLNATISLTNITNLKATATFTNCKTLSDNDFELFIGEGNGTAPIATNQFQSNYSIVSSPQTITINWSDFSGFNPNTEFTNDYILWMDNQDGSTKGQKFTYGSGVAVTSFSLNLSFIKAVEDADGSGFKVVYDTLYTSSTGDLLEITGGDIGTTYSYTLPNGSVINGGTKQYFYTNFLDGGSPFTPTSGMEYDLTLQVTAGPSGFGKVKYTATSTPFIQTSNPTPNDITVTITNYTTVAGDKLVITPLSGSPSHVLPSGTTDSITLSFADDFSTIISAGVTYTITLKLNNDSVVASDTFQLPAADNPSFELGPITDSDFEITIVQLYTPAVGDTLRIKSTGGSILATYTFIPDDIGVDVARTYAYNTFDPSTFKPTPGTPYNLVLTSVVPGYFTPFTTTLQYDPLVAPLVITNVSINGFTVDYSKKSGIITGYKLSIVATGLPFVTIGTDPTQPIPYLFNAFSPSFSPLKNTLYTVNVVNGSNIVMTSSFTILAPPPPPPPAPCFREGTQILCVQDGKETYLPIESLKPGMRVKTLQNGYLPIELIGYTTLQNPGHAERIQNRLYKCSIANYPTLSDDLYITGCHSILVDNLTDTQRQDTITQFQKIYITDDKYRLMACIDDRAIPYANENSFKIWHIALENTEYYHNYGIWANGLLVETCSKRYLRELSGMTLVV